MTFCVTGLGKQKLILRHSWLRKHNPEIDWNTGKVQMSWCPPQWCSGCRDELHQEWITQKAETKRIDACSVGPLPEVDHNSDDNSEPNTVDLEDESNSIEEGDQILATGLFPTPPMEIWASSTISQRLAEAFQANTEVTTLSENSHLCSPSNHLMSSWNLGNGIMPWKSYLGLNQQDVRSILCLW